MLAWRRLTLRFARFRESTCVSRRHASILEKPGQIYRPAMRAHFAGNLEGNFQLCQRLPNIRRRNGAEHGPALIADNISLIPANDAVQAAAALRIAKV